MIGDKLYLAVYFFGSVLIEYDTVGNTFSFYTLFNEAHNFVRGLYSINERLYFSGCHSGWSRGFVVSTGKDNIEITPNLILEPIESTTIQTSNIDSEVTWETSFSNRINSDKTFFVLNQPTTNSQQLTDRIFM